MLTIGADDPLAVVAIAAIQTGDVEQLRKLLAQHPALATARFGSETCQDDPGATRSLLQVATDWPGHFPNGAATVAALVQAGADPNARVEGPHTETPLHWAASSDDVEVLDALIDAGADIEAPGAVIGGGTPLADAVAFGQWNAARRLVERGARAPIREAAALGLLDRLEDDLRADPPPWPDDLTQALWYACHGGQQPAAERLLDQGGDLNWVSTWDQLTPLDAAVREGHDEVASWLRSKGAKSASDLA
jgi:ankyrin repeat protein